jgi:probable F420-dependent oxidoreductase
MTVQVGVLLPQGGRSAGPASLTAFAAKAEELGFASLWVGDHVCLPTRQDTPYPYPLDSDDPLQYQVPSDRPYLEALTTLGFVAAVTTTVDIGLSVGILPYRHPALWAKSLGTLQRLSGNRLLVGAGTGWMAEEFAVLGADFAGRDAVTDDTLAFLRHAWSAEGAVDFESDRFTIRDFWLVPPGPDEVVPPIWVGGNGRRALERTARHGDVWHPYLGGTSPNDVRTGLVHLADRGQQLGRDTPFTAAVHMPLQLSGSSSRDPWEVGTVVGDARVVRDLVRRYGDAGVSHVVLNFGGSTARRLEVLEELADCFEGELSA